MTAPSEQLRRSEAALHEWTWKTPAMKAMTLAIVRLAVERGGGKFSANDLPKFEHGGSGVCGSIFHRLVDDGVIARVGHFVGSTFYPLIVLNPGGNKISVYRLANYARAFTLLRVQGQPEPQMQQQEFSQP